MDTTLETTGTDGVLIAILRMYLTLALPVLLVMASIRVIMTPVFLNEEYTRADFPADYYGFTTEDRLAYAPYAVEYLLNGEDITYLSNLRFPNGTALFNARELHHMRDVKTVTQAAFVLAIAAGISMAAAVYRLGRSAATRREMWQGLFNGSILTLGLIAAIVLAAVVNWEFFFTGFHSLFFQSGTWYFAYSDTLIRLFPEQFWFDAALAAGGLTTAGALATLAVSWRGKRRQRVTFDMTFP